MVVGVMTDEQEIIRLYRDELLTMTQVAARTGKHYCTVRNTLIRNGVQRRGSKSKDDLTPTSGDYSKCSVCGGDMSFVPDRMNSHTSLRLCYCTKCDDHPNAWLSEGQWAELERDK